MRFKKEYGLIIGFVATLLVPSVAGIFVHNNFKDEKRTPAEFPSSFSDSFFDQINSWYSDNAPFRTGLINIYNAINNALETPFRNWLINIDVYNKQHNHEHVFTEWEIVKDATEEESGLKTRECTICGKKEEEVIPQIPHVHTFSDEWDYNEYEHWHNATCAHTNIVSELDTHTYGEILYDNEGKEYHMCEVCGCISYIAKDGEHAHAYSNGWSNDDNYHWHKAVCEHTDLKSNYEEHSFSEWHVYDESNGLKARTCSVCGYDQIKDISNNLERDINNKEYTYYPYVEATKNVLYGREDWLFYLGNNSMSYYKGTNVMTNEYRDSAIAKMKKLQSVCDEKGITLIYAVFPNKDHIYEEYMPTVEGKLNALTRLQQFNNYIQFNTSFNFIYPLTTLIEEKKNYPTYYKQDSHWNEYGGAVTAKELFKRLGWEFKDLSIEEIEHIGGDLASMSSLAPATYLEPKVTYYKDVSLEQTYGSTYMERYVSGNKNGKKLLFVGDSYRFSIVKFFAKEVENTLCVHRNRLTAVSSETTALLEYIKSLKSGDILFYSSVERLDTDMFNKLDKLIAAFN